jgi:hypothetical protein
MQIKRIAAAAMAATMAASALAAPAGAATAVKRPSGKYTGVTSQNGSAILKVSKDRKYVKLVGFQFYCDEKTVGFTGLKNLRLKKTSKGYKFSASGITSSAAYSDDTSEDGTVAVSGRFKRDAKSVFASFRVQTPRCGDTGRVPFFAEK